MKELNANTKNIKCIIYTWGNTRNVSYHIKVIEQTTNTGKTPSGQVGKRGKKGDVIRGWQRNHKLKWRQLRIAGMCQKGVGLTNT